jgi:hypothetical protein
VRAWVALPLLSLFLLVPASASAGTASVAGDATTAFVWYRANQSPQPEKNDVTVTRDGGGVVFHDAGAPVEVDGCEQLDEHTARCTPLPGARVLVAVLTGELNDRVVNVNVNANITIDGGSGNDTLSTQVGGSSINGGSGADVLTGSPGDDVLVGGLGRDHLYGREGNDRLAGDGDGFFVTRAADAIDGGPGADVAVWGRRTTGVHVDLRRAGGQGAPGEGDVVSGIEGVETSGGADRIVAPSSSATCGARRDEVVLPGPEALIARDCERTRAARALVAFTARWKVGDGVFSLPLRSRQSCLARVALFDGSTRLGGATVALKRGKEGIAQVPLSHHGPVRVEVRGCGPLLAFSLLL